MEKAEKLAQVSLTLNGKVVSAPELVSRYKGTKILSVDIENKRLSGGVDTFNVHFANDLGVVIEEGMYIEVTGDIRTLNVNNSNRVIYQFVMAKTVKVLDGEPAEYRNEVEISDAEMTNFEGVRKSYSDPNKTLATYHICLRRKHGRSSYFRVTTWGRDSVFLGNIHKSVQYLHLKCRLQSFVSQSTGRNRFCLVSYYLEVPESEKSVSPTGNAGSEVADGDTTNRGSENAETVIAENTATSEGAVPAEETV